WPVAQTRRPPPGQAHLVIPRATCPRAQVGPPQARPLLTAPRAADILAASQYPRMRRSAVWRCEVENGVPKPTLQEIGETPYQAWLKEQDLPIYTGSFVRDLHTAEVAPWPRFGQKGAIVILAEQEKNDAWLLEIEPGGQTNEMHHICEASYYVVEGSGATTIWQAGSDAKQTVEWHTGSLFSPPLNSHYQHFNLDGQRPARLFA